MKKTYLVAIVTFVVVIALNGCFSFGGDDDDNQENPKINYWQKANSPTNEVLTAVYFINESTGWAVGYNSTILKTTDGGKNWNNQQYDDYASFNDVFFIDANIGWIVGQYGTVIKTTNGGQTWTLQTNGYKENGFTESLKKIAFIDNNTGWIIGDAMTGSGGIILKTTNGGQSWSISIGDLPTHLFSLKVIDSNHVLVGGGFDSPALLYETNDGGFNWKETTIGKEKFTVDDIAYHKGSIYLVCGWQTFGFISTDSGVTWSSSSLFGPAYNIFVNDDYIWLSGGFYKYSTDNGVTWTETKEKNSEYVNNGNGTNDNFCLGNKIWGVASNGSIFYCFLED